MTSFISPKVPAAVAAPVPQEEDAGTVARRMRRQISKEQTKTVYTNPLGLQGNGKTLLSGEA